MAVDAGQVAAEPEVELQQLDTGGDKGCRVAGTDSRLELVHARFHETYYRQPCTFWL
jgi:hypothetical protein